MWIDFADQLFVGAGLSRNNSIRDWLARPVVECYEKLPRVDDTGQFHCKKMLAFPRRFSKESARNDRYDATSRHLSGFPNVKRSDGAGFITYPQCATSWR